MSNLRKLWKSRLYGALIPAVPVPFKKDASVDWESQNKYIHYLKIQPIEGVAVWAHTGRGLFLDRKTRNSILREWREQLPKSRFIVAGIGVRPYETLSDREYLKNTEKMLQDAIDGGADLIMPYAPTRYRNIKDKENKILEYYRLIDHSRLPIVLFYLYEEAGGIEFYKDLLEKLLNLENVVGVKLATLDSVITFQDITDLIRKRYPDITVISGEDRFLPYSFQIGADAALIGMAAACTGMYKEMIRAWINNRYKKFYSLAQRVDEFGSATFREPMEGYIQRILYVLAKLGIISPEAVFDPYGPQLSHEDFERVDIMLKKLNLL